ncbi:MAG: hypothetical protein IPK72_25650 [Candidatus Eisenbacteria bacterium]|nr:hypothetical protein [Candidatus Eisenbacteria bacterium]
MNARVLKTLFLLLVRDAGRRKLPLAIAILAAGLGGALVLSTIAAGARARSAFNAAGAGFDAVLAARSSPLQCVLSGIFHLEPFIANLPWDFYVRMADDPRIEVAIPIAGGDSYEGIPILGTDAALFEVAGEPERWRLSRNSRLFDPLRREAVIGSVAAAETGLNLGDHFHPAHGPEEGGEEHDDEYLVVGVMEPTGSPADRVIWIPLEGVLRMSGHMLQSPDGAYAPDPDEEIPDDMMQVSAVLLRVRDTSSGFSLDQEWNRDGRDATFAWPVTRLVASVVQRLGWVEAVLRALSWFTVLAGFGFLFAIVHHSLRERRGELATLRTVGAPRSVVISIPFLEGAVFGALAGLVAYALHHVILVIVARYVRSETGLDLSGGGFDPTYVTVAALFPLCGGLIGLLAGLGAYRWQPTELLRRSG